MTTTSDSTKTAPTVKELIAALRDTPPGSTWLVEKGPYGHAEVLVFNRFGDQIRTIRNKP